MSLNASWPLPRLLDALGRAGWADLDTGAAQGIRSTLRALSSLLPDGSALGNVTTAQVADAAGLSTRWTARCLRYLEAVGLISWTRGQIIAGRPTPGLIRVAKSVLVELIRKARGQIDDRRRERADETSRRIRETLRRGTALNRHTATTFKPKPRETPSRVHVELRSTLPPIGEGTVGTPSPVTQLPRGERAKRLRELMNRGRS